MECLDFLERDECFLLEDEETEEVDMEAAGSRGSWDFFEGGLWSSRKRAWRVEWFVSRFVCQHQGSQPNVSTAKGREERRAGEPGSRNVTSGGDA